MPQGVLYAAIVQPKVTHHAKILAIHTEEAEKMPGVVKVITAKDLIAAGGTNIMAEGQFHERRSFAVITLTTPGIFSASSVWIARIFA